MRPPLSKLASKPAGLGGRARGAIAAAIVLVVAIGAAGGWYVVRARTAAVPPTTVTLNLNDGQEEVPLDQELVLRSSRPIALETFRAHLSIGPDVAGTLDVSADHRTFTWRPSQSWAELTAYTVQVGAAVDASGNRIARAGWRFTTTIVPRILGLTTSAGSAVADGAEIPLGSGLVLAFNDAMDPATVSLTANGAALALDWAADHRSAAIAPALVHAGALQLALQPGAKDSVGRPVTKPWALAASVIFHPAMHTIPLRAPAMVQIPNDPQARDQTGVQAASVVFESVAEGGITRFTAVFQNAPDRVGPVRSARLISIEATRHYHGMLFASGDSQGTNRRLLADPVPYLFDNGDNRTFYRTYDRAAPNNLFIDATTLERWEERAGLGAVQLPTGPVTLDGQPAPQVTVPLHHSTYEYDPATATYLKTEEGHRMADAAIGRPLHIQLLVVLHTQVTVTSIIEDANGAHGLDYNLDASGRAEFYHQGRMATGTWSSADRSSPLTFTLDGGTPLSLPGGLVWVDVIP